MSNVVKGPWLAADRSLRELERATDAVPPTEYFVGLAIGQLFRALELVYDRSRLAQRMAYAAARKRRMKVDLS